MHGKVLGLRERVSRRRRERCRVNYSFAVSLLLSPVSHIFPPMLSLTFLGTGAACPTIERNVASVAVQREGETMLFDCGEGTQRQMMRYGVSFAFRDIFFTHWHSDHLLGVIGLLRTMGLLNIFGGQERRDPLVLYGPKGAERILRHALEVGIERVKFPVEIRELKVGDVIKRDQYDITTFATDHRADTLGYALVERQRLGRFHPERARELGVPGAPAGTAAQGRDRHHPEERPSAQRPRRPATSGPHRCDFG